MRSAWIVVAALALGCGPKEKPAATEKPAAPAVEKTPAAGLKVFLSGFDYVAAAPAEQLATFQYCDSLNDDLIQCAIYDGKGADAKLIGVEHIVSRQVFDQLPREEKRLWHALNYEVKSGLLVAPGMPPNAEHALMQRLVSAYGKTWHLWISQEVPLPVGPAWLMKGFTDDGQVDAELVRQRDQALGIDTAMVRKARADIEDPGFDPVVLEIGPPPGVEPPVEPPTGTQPPS